MNHPWVAGGLAWWALLGLTLHLNFGALLIGLLPTFAVVVNYWLTRRKVEEVHVIVNSQRDAMKTKEAALEVRIIQLEATIRDSNMNVPATTREIGRP